MKTRRPHNLAFGRPPQNASLHVNGQLKVRLCTPSWPRRPPTPRNAAIEARLTAPPGRCRSLSFLHTLPVTLPLCSCPAPSRSLFPPNPPCLAPSFLPIRPVTLHLCSKSYLSRTIFAPNLTCRAPSLLQILPVALQILPVPLQNPIPNPTYHAPKSCSSLCAP